MQNCALKLDVEIILKAPIPQDDLNFLSYLVYLLTSCGLYNSCLQQFLSVFSPSVCLFACLSIYPYTVFWSVNLSLCFLCPSVCIYVCPHIRQSTCLYFVSVYLSLSLLVTLSICQIVFMALCLHISLSICKFVCSICQFVNLSFCQFVYLSVCLSLCLSICQFVNL